MLTDALHTPTFGIIVSFMFGLALVMVVFPMCRGQECMIVKAPPIHEVKESVYKIAKKCYKFDTVQMDCPASGAVEAFENSKRA